MYIAGTSASWQLLGWQLLASGVLLLCGYQALESRSRMGAAFWFVLATAWAVSALRTGSRANSRWAAALCAAVLCCEILLILRWIFRSRSKRPSQ
jgi:hypothetical protein